MEQHDKIFKVIGIILVILVGISGIFYVIIQNQHEKQDSEENNIKFSYKNITLIKDRTPYLIKETHDSADIYARGKTLYKNPFKTLSENDLKIVYCNTSLDREMIKYYEKEGNWERLKNSSLVKRC